MGIEAVVFDWGGVLAGGANQDVSEIERRLGVPPGLLPGLMGMHPCDTDPDNLLHLRELGRAPRWNGLSGIRTDSGPLEAFHS